MKKTDVREIGSPAHPVIKLALALKSAHGRKKHGLLMLEGLRAIDAAISADFLFKAAVFAQGVLDSPGGRLMVDRLRSKKIPVYAVPERLYGKITAMENPQGAGLICGASTRGLSECLRGDWLVVTDRVQDPGNLGAILRSARAFGADGLLATEGTCEIGNPKTLRAAAGAWPGIPTAEGIEPERLRDELCGSGHRILVSSSRAGRDFRSVDWRGRIALVLGNESRGAEESFFAAPALGVRIPHLSCVESLNVSVAASILLAEAYRMRGGNSRLSARSPARRGKEMN